MKSRGLGKGLNALIVENIEEIDEKVEVKKDINVLKTIEIEPNREQPRQVFDEDSLIELSDSIKEYGILQPLLVTKDDGYYKIIAGERRWRAAKKAGLKQIPVIIKEYNAREVLEVSLIENLQREDLNPIEEAKAYQQLVENYKLKQDDISKKVAKSRSSIANSMRLLNLDGRVQQMLIDDMISTGHARPLLAINDKELQYQMAINIFDQQLSARETEKYVKSQLAEPKIKKIQKNNLSPIYKNIEDRMKEIMGTKVQILKGKKKGKIEIEYYSDEDLDRIVDLFESI